MNRRGFFKKIGKGLLGVCAAAVGLKILPDAKPGWNLKTKSDPYMHKLYVKGGRRWSQITVNTAASKERWVDETLVPGWTKEDQGKWEGRIHYDLIKVDMDPQSKAFLLDNMKWISELNA